MEQVNDSEKFSYATEPVAADKTAADNNSIKSRTWMIVIILFSVCFVISVGSLVCIFLAQDDSPKEMGERFSQMEQTIKELSAKLQKDEEQLKTLRTEISELRDKPNERPHYKRPFVDDQQNSTDLPQNSSVGKALHSEHRLFRRSAQDTISCRQGYEHNPYANSCIRLVSTSKSWHSARGSCESAGERLATFETLDSQYWFITLRKTSWTTKAVWIGGESFSTDAWRWLGAPTGMKLAVWGPGEPSGSSERCMESLNSKDYKFNDESCSRTHYYVCERIA